jgi:hypothetical protein
MVCEDSFAVKMFYRKGRGGGAKGAKGAKGNIYRIPNLKLPMLNFELAPELLLFYSFFTAKAAEVVQRAQSKNKCRMMNIESRSAQS